MGEPAVNISACVVEHGKLGRGVTVYLCWDPEWIAPVGLVWGHERRGRFDVLGSHVAEWARRCGVRTLINKAILEDHGAVVSDFATSRGKAFMEARGYTRTWFEGWELRKPLAKKRPRRRTRRAQHRRR